MNTLAKGEICEGSILEYKLDGGHASDLRITEYTFVTCFQEIIMHVACAVHQQLKTA